MASSNNRVEGAGFDRPFFHLVRAAWPCCESCLDGFSLPAQNHAGDPSYANAATHPSLG